MKVISLAISNLLSFDDFALDFDDRLTVIVGPNGSGKTNIIRALDLVSKLVDWADERSRSAAAVPSPADMVISSYVQTAHDACALGTPIEVRLGVEFTTASERERLVAFVRAAVLTMLAEDSQAGDETLKTRLASWVTAEIDERKLHSLFKGVLVFRHPGYDDAVWDARYQFHHAGKTYDWILYSRNAWDSVVPHDSVVAVPATKVWEALLGQPANISDPPALPDPLPHFELDAMCLPAGKKLANLVVRVGTGSFNDQHQPFRAVANLLGFPASGSMGQQAFGMARAMRLSVEEGVVILGEQFRGLGIGGTVPWRAGLYPWELVAGPVPRGDPGFLPLRLFQLKNGVTTADRERFVAVQRQFERLAPGRSFDVTFTAAKVPVPATTPIGAGQVVVPGGAEQAQAPVEPGSIVTVVAWEATNHGEQRRERPIQLFGAGTWEALVLAEALVDCDGRLTVLDEPAVTLHPTWQAALRAELRRVAGQMVLVTHSPSLLPMESPDDLRRIVRMTNRSGASRSHRVPAAVNDSDLARMTRRFGLSADARALLFCRGAVVVSGETELGALPVWCAKGKVAREFGTPSDLDLAFYSVAGDGGFASVLSALHAFDVPWVLLCDGKSFDIETGWSGHVFRQIQRAGIDIADLAAFVKRANEGGKAQRTMTDDLWNEQPDLGERHGIVTFATRWTPPDEGVEAFFERAVPGKLAEAEAEVGTGSKVRKGLWVAQQTECPDEVDKFFREAVRALPGVGGQDFPTAGE